MKDPNPLPETADTPEDVASLYSWANLHGAKYRDFSVARAETREKARLRAELAAQEGRSASQIDAVTGPKHPALAAADSPLALPFQSSTPSRQALGEAAGLLEPIAELRGHEFFEPAARLAGEPGEIQALETVNSSAVEQSACQVAEQAAGLSDYRAAEPVSPWAAELVEKQSAVQAGQDEPVAHPSEETMQEVAKHAAQSSVWQQHRAEAFSSSYPSAEGSHPPVSNIPHPSQTAESTSQVLPASIYPPNFQANDSSPFASHYSPVREESSMSTRNPWTTPEAPETAGKPAWLSNGHGDVSTSEAQSAPVTPAADDTLQGSRDRLTSRWFALRGIFEAVPPPVEPTPAPVVARPPAMAIFSLAGGVGKTSLVATLGRALSSRGERVLLVDTAAFGLLPFFFGATDQRPGVLRTFSPPGLSTDVPLQMVTLDPDGLGSEAPEHDGLNAEIEKFSRGAGRVIVDLATASGATTRRILRLQPLVLVPLIPDMNSVVSVSSIDAFFEHNSAPGAKPTLPFYVLNQFEANLPLHLDVREVLREQLGERLLPFALRRTPAMSEALAEGMTIMDYAPAAELAEDFVTLAGWVKSLSAPAKTTYRGVRWSER